MSDRSREFLRHTVAALAYRANKCLQGMPPEAADFRVADGSRTPAQILAHMGDLLDWAVALSKGERKWHDSQPLPWDQEIERFFSSLNVFDSYLASDQPLACAVEKLFQGPVADALTHIGQIAMLRRIAGAPIRGENYYVAKVEAGRVGRDQAVPVREFD